MNMNATITSGYEDALAFDRLLAGRHSCRGFRPDPVPRETIERILATAQRTASWCNAQPWQITIASGDAARDFGAAMLEAAGSPAEPTDFEWPQDYQGVYGERRRECGLALYTSVGIAKGDRAAAARQALENFRLFGAPHVAIVTSDATLGTYGAVDCGAWVANFMTAAVSHGVACIAQAALAKRPSIARAHFSLGTDRRVVCGISFGYADAAHPANGFRTTRAALADVVSWHG
jgi:nitroreductase